MTTIDTTPEQGQAFLSRDADAPVAMLNLLKFKDKATYEADRSEAGENLTGQEAYARYGVEVGKILEKMGAKVVYAGPINGMLIGEGDWDMVAIVQYPNRPTMASLDSREDYAAIHYHRAAGLAHQLLIDTTQLT